MNIERVIQFQNNTLLIKDEILEEKNDAAKQTLFIKSLGESILKAEKIQGSQNALAKVVFLLNEGNNQEALIKLKKFATQHWINEIHDSSKQMASYTIIGDLLKYNGEKRFSLGTGFYDEKKNFPWFLLYPVQEIVLLENDQQNLPQELFNLPNLKKIAILWNEIKAIPFHETWAKNLEELSIKAPLKGITSLRNLKKLCISFQNPTDFNKLEDLGSLSKLHTVVLNLSMLNVPPETFGQLTPHITHINGYISTMLPFADLPNVSMKDRLQIHNRVLYQLLYEIFNPMEPKKYLEFVNLYYQDSEKFNQELLKKSSYPILKEKLLELEALKMWGMKSILKEDTTSEEFFSLNTLPYHSNYLEPQIKEKVLENLKTQIKFPKAIRRNEIEEATNIEIWGKKRLNITFEVSKILFYQFFQTYFLAYAKSPKEGEEWEATILNTLADTLIDKMNKKGLTAAQQSEIKEAICHGKIWIEEQGFLMKFNQPYINFKSAWFPKAPNEGYKIVESKKIRSLELWQTSVT